MVITIDEFLVATNSETVYNTLIKQLQLKYRVKDLGKATRLIGWTVTPIPKTGGLHLS